MSNKEDTMRKTRHEESSKNLSSSVRSRISSKNQVASKGEISETKKKILEKKTVGDRQLKTTVKTSNASLSKNHENEERIASRSKVPGTSRSSVVDSTRRTSKTVVKNATAQLRNAKNADTEKRGISTIYMPKTSRGSSSSGLSEGKKTSVASLTRSKDLSAKPNSRRGKDASIQKNLIKSGYAADKGHSMKTKDAPVESKNQHPTRRRLPSKERRRSRTLSPSEVKVLRSNMPANRGRSSKKIIPAQIRLSNDVDIRDEKTVENDMDDEEYEHEDDFESYESDFEECTDSEVSEVSEESSTSNIDPEPEPIELRTEKQKTTVNSVDGKKSDDERMLDSGHYDLAEARRRAARIESVSMPREAKRTNAEITVQPIVSPYREDRSSGNKSLPSSTDEGFEDARSGDFAKSPPMSQITFIDFRKNATDKAAAQSAPRVLTRGEKLLEMIKLDTVEWSILESKPVAYEEFIRTHGKLNTRQICIQTNEDDFCAETQTETIELSSKWTQFPTKCRTVIKNDDDINAFNMERLGVGSDDCIEVANATRPIYDVLQLNDFLSQAGRVMLSLLDERRSSGNDSSEENHHELPFSDSVVKLSIDSVAFLAGRPVNIIHYSNVSNRVLLTIHAPVDEDIETARDEGFVTDCSIGCVWNILQASKPIKLFYSSSAITACCFHSTNYNVVLAGLADGSISLWDLAEDEIWHRKVVDRANKFEWIVRSPTYSSIGNFDEDDHNSGIVALRVLSKIENESRDAACDKFMPIQICSLDENGRLIIWSVLRNLGRASIDDLGLSWWGELRLVKSQEISLFSKKSSERNNHLKGFSDVHVDRLNKNALYVATNTTDILHATRIGKHANPPAYKANGMDWCGDTKCIESCPFDKPYFMIGCGDGTVRLHSATAEKPLLQLKHENYKAAVKTVQWSRSKPLMLYVLDVDSKIHIWDLASSDMFPLHTISTDNWAHIESIQLSPCRTRQETTNQYMALASDDGRVEVHRLKEEFCYSQKDAVKREMNTFLRYVAIL